MPTAGAIITPEELRAMHKRGVSKVDLTFYLDYLGKIPDKHGGVVYLEPDDLRPVIKRRISKAATALKIKVTYAKQAADSTDIQFSVKREPVPEVPPSPTSEPEAATPVDAVADNTPVTEPETEKSGSSKRPSHARHAETVPA